MSTLTLTKEHKGRSVIAHDGSMRGTLKGLKAKKYVRGPQVQAVVTVLVDGMYEDKNIQASKLGLWHKGPTVPPMSYRKAKRLRVKASRRANRGSNRG